MIGVDTLQVNLSGYDLKPGHKVTVRPSPYSPTSGELYGDYVLWPGQHGSAAFYNDPRGRYFFDVKPIAGHVRGSVHLSLPKYATGGRDNTALLSRDAAGEVMRNLERELGEVGIATDLSSAQLSRLDITRNVHPSEAFSVYRPVLQLIEGKRMKDRKDYIDGFTWGNTKRQVCCYDKLSQLTSQKYDTTGMPNTLRFEYRLRQAEACRNLLGYGNVGSLLQEYDGLADVYRSEMKKLVFDITPDEFEQLSGRQLTEELRQFREIAGRRWLSAWLEAYGTRQLVKLAEVDTLMAAIREVSGDRMKPWRFAKKLRAAKVNSHFLKHDPASKKTYRSLYGELRQQVLKAA